MSVIRSQARLCLLLLCSRASCSKHAQFLTVGWQPWALCIPVNLDL